MMDKKGSAPIFKYLFVCYTEFYASNLRCHFSFYRRVCIRKFLYAFQKSKRMGLGKLLDHWRTFFLADCSTTCSLAHHTQFFRNHCANGWYYIILHLYFWLVMGNWRTDLWLGRPLSRCFTWQQHYPGALHGVWCPHPLNLL